MRTKPYTEIGLQRKKCERCGAPARFQWRWDLCADPGRARFIPFCAKCDIELNELSLLWIGDPNTEQKIAAYRERGNELMFKNPPHVRWWSILAYADKQKVMRRNIAPAEFRKLHSKKAAVMWWALLSNEDRAFVFRAETRP